MYMTLDAQFHVRWKIKGGHQYPKVIKSGFTRKYKDNTRTIGTPRLWSKLINKIIIIIIFKAYKHKPCLYYYPNYKEEQLYFLRQVDDLAISSPTSNIAIEVINIIDKHITIKVKPICIIDKFNGDDIIQIQHYIKMSNEMYFTKISQEKTFQSAHTHIPLHSEC